MPCCVCAGASITCSFGAAPSVLNVLPGARVMSSQALASIMDNISVMNIMPFGMCSSLANPNVASATAAALGRRHSDSISGNREYTMLSRCILIPEVI